MFLVDLLIVTAIVCAGAWGWRRGERAGRRRDLARRRRTSGHRRLAVAGSLICTGAALLIGGALTRVGELSDRLRDSIVLGAFVSTPGDGLRADAESTGSGAGPGAPATLTVTAAGPVRRAARSVVRLRGSTCGRGVSGSGWIAHGGIIVTNAHVIAGQHDTTAQLWGRGPALPTTPIWFAPEDDIALLRAPALARAPGLQLAGADVRRGTRAAVLGFPLGGPLKVLSASMDRTSELPEGERIGDGRSSQIRMGAVTRVQTRAQAGSSGSAVVDGRGRVLTTVFAADGLVALGVSNDVVRDALRRADGRVDTGGCE